MEVGDFTSTVACFMRLTWAAAAGRLDLVGSPQPIRETPVSLLPQGVRTRVSSTGETFTSPLSSVCHSQTRFEHSAHLDGTTVKEAKEKLV